MKLLSLKLENYRQHRDTFMEFPEGVTAVIGPNGSGKSTLLEAITWCIYGQRANTRDKAKDILWTRAPARANVRVELVFELHDQAYRVARDLKTASLHLEGKDTPIVTGLNDVTAYLEQRLGMDYRAFFNSYFTRQKELAFLAHESAADRQKLINKMLGLEALEKARRQVNADRLAAGRQIEGMERGIVDLAELQAQLAAVQQAAALAEQTWRDADLLASQREAGHAAVLPRFEASARRAEQAAAMQAAMARAEQEGQHRQREVARLGTELAELEARGGELLRLQPELERWEAMQEEYRQQEVLQRHESRRRELLGQQAGAEKQEAEWQRKEASLAVLLDHDALARARREALLAKQHADELAEQLHRREIAWREAQAGREAELKGRRKERTAVVKRREVIAAGGGDGDCPTCLRAVTPADLPQVLRALDAQLAELDEALAALEREQAAAVDEHAALKRDQPLLPAARKRYEQLQKQECDLEAQHEVRRNVATSLARVAAERQRLAAEQAALPQGFDPARWEALQLDRKRFEPLKTREAALRALLKEQPRKQAELATAQQAHAQAREQHREQARELAALGFSADAHEQLGRELAALDAAAREARAVAAERRGDVQKQAGRLEELRRQEAEVRQKLDQLEELRREHRYLVVLEDHLEALRAELNGRVRPELEAAASQFIEQLTDGRYRALELDENYGIRLVDEGEAFPLERFSGGESDIAHLCLRLAISEMIVQRAGQPLSLMILDEVFGSLDETRRDNVMTLLESLRRRFSQIVLITHIEEVKHATDHLIRVEFDEKSGASKIEAEPGMESPASVYA